MNQDLWLILIGVLALAVIARFWARRRAAKRAAEAARRSQARPAAEREASPSGPLPTMWEPPRYEAARDAMAGPSLRIGIGMIRLSDDGLLVSWNATNNGSLPVAVQWGAPEVRVEDDWLRLLYTRELAPSFVAPETRTYQPGEILSRSATVPRESIGREPVGMRVTVAVGYGNAEEHEAVRTDQGAYLDWQRVAISPPRVVPRP